MPWEKTFNMDQAIDQATQVFWQKGYESASLNDLMKAIGINKGSFYNAFGSKKKLFTACLLKYDREQRQAVFEELAAMNNPTFAITTLFDELVQQSIADKDCKGCFMVNTALDLPHHDEDTEKTVKEGFAEVVDFFKQQIELGHQIGAIPTSVDANITANSLLTLLVGLRVLARGVFDADSLQRIKTQAISLIKPY